MKEQGEIYPNNFGLSPSEVKSRNFYLRLCSVLFPTRVVNGREYLDQAAKYIEDTSKGVGVRFTHFGRTDPMHAMVAVTTQPFLSSLRAVAPAAYHQLEQFRWLHLRERAQRAAMELVPVMTKNSVDWARKKGNTRGVKAGVGLREYFDRSAKVLARGGLDFSAPQGERESHLFPFSGTPMSTFEVRMHERGVDEFGLLFVGFELPGIKAYGKVSGWNLKRVPYLVSMRFFSHDEKMAAVEGNVESLNAWGYQQLEALSPAPYRLPKPS